MKLAPHHFLISALSSTAKIPLSIVLVSLLTTPASAEKLSLSFFPPDMRQDDICTRAAESFDEEETQVADPDAPVILQDDERVAFIKRDIRNLRRADPVANFAFILDLITKQAELDPTYAGIKESFDRINTYLAAGKVQELGSVGLVQDLANNLDTLGWTDTLRLSRFFRDGVGVPKDEAFANQLILDQAYLGNSDALLEVLRMQLRGEGPADWTLTAEETAKLGFGGLIGKTNRGLCNRAERMAREYLDGDILTPNPDLAYAWRKFAADLGDAKAAWRIVEYHLAAAGSEKNDSTLRHYLQIAVENGVVIEPDTIASLREAGASTETEVRKILGANSSRVGTSNRASAVQHLNLEARLVSPEIAEDGKYLKYLEEISQLPTAPGQIKTRLGKRILLRKGRWAGADEAERYLREGLALGDPDAARPLAELILASSRDRARFQEAENLLIENVETHGVVAAMSDLDAFYRCRLPDAPRLSEASFWAKAFRDADTAPVGVSSSDLSQYDPRYEPEALARIQSLALEGHATSKGDWLQYLQSDHNTPASALRHWAAQVSANEVALERFVRHEVELARTPLERQNALELIRRGYLDIGSAISLDLAITLVENGVRGADQAETILQILEASAKRGEGASLRLLQKLSGRAPADLYADYADVIEKRGDLVSLMFAGPHVSDADFERIMRRAIAIMNCNTKDITEVITAYTERGDAQKAFHWLQILSALENGNSLMNLSISEYKMANFGRRISIAEDMLPGPYEETDELDRLRKLFLETADPHSPSHDLKAAAGYLASLFAGAKRPEFLWALARYREADPELRAEIDAQVDIRSGLFAAAEAGDAVAQFEAGLLLRAIAETEQDLTNSTEWLFKAANAGHADAMVELARSAAFGIGREADRKLALIWLDRADRMRAGHGRDLRTILQAMEAE